MTACTCPHCGQPMPAGRAVAVNTAGLTERMAEVLLYLDQQERLGRTPSVRDIAKHLGHASPASAHRILSELEERGRIRRLPGRARAITLLKQPTP